MRLLLLLAILVASPFVSRSAILFDAADDIVGFGTTGDNVFREDQAFSFSCRFFAVSDGEANTGNFIRRGSVLFRLTATQGIRFSVAGGTVLLRVAANSSFSLGAWNHIVVTWDGSTTAANVHIYINATEVSYATTTDGVAPTDNSADPLVIGNNVTLGGTFDGQLSELAVWGSVLTQTDVNALFYGKVHLMPFHVASGTLLAYWPLDDFADGATVTGVGLVKDLSGNGYHGTATNSPISRAVVVHTYP